MSEPAGLMAFTGIRQIIAGNYTLSHGISPGVAQLTIAPQPVSPPVDGVLTITFGGVVLAFDQCRLISASFEYDGSGLVQRLIVNDKRWRWKFGTINGSYNLRWPDGSLNVTTEATPVELMTKCLRAMNEPRFNLSQVPNTTRPEIHWDHDNPAQALAELADGVGCRVVLRLDGTVAVMQTGLGIQLPVGDADLIQSSTTVNPPQVPDSLLYVAGVTRYQADFLLEAVGLDVDGKVKPINKLSYKPADGWGLVGPPYFGGIPEGRGRELARDTVYRWYRIPPEPLGHDGRALRIAGYDKEIQSRYEVLPIESEQVDFGIDAVEVVMLKEGQPAHFPVPKNKPPYIWGFWPARNTGYQPNLNPDVVGDEGRAFGGSLVPMWTNPKAEYRGAYSLDTVEGIVKFNDYVYYFAEGVLGKRVVPATLCMRVACPIRDKAGKNPLRYTRERKTGQNHGTGARPIRHDETQAAYLPTIGAHNNIAGVRTNIKEPFAAGATPVQTEADHYLDVAMREYQNISPTEAVWAGIKLLNPDGAIQAVSWDVGAGGATTRASRDNEISFIRVPYRERRMLEKLWGARQEEAEANDRLLRLARAFDRAGKRAFQMGG